MRLYCILWMLGTLCLAGICKGQPMLLSTDESQVSWTGSAAVGSYQLHGSLAVAEGFLDLKEGLVREGRVALDMKRIDSETPGLCDHLRKKDFFHVKKYPQATFELTKPCALVEGEGFAEGKLSLRGIEKQVKIPVAVVLEKGRVELRAKLVVDRTEFGMRYNSPSFFENLGNQAIADEMEVETRLVFVQE